MSSFYLTLLAVLLAGWGARDQATVAGISLRHGRRLGVLVTGLLVSIATAAFAGWAVTFVAPLLAPPARLFLAGIALVFAGGESLLIVPRRAPAEPTHSLPALAIVLLAHQLTDAARFLVFGIGVATNGPLAAALGGALGGIILIGGAWEFPELPTHHRVGLIRRSVGAGLLLVGAFVCLGAVGII